MNNSRSIFLFACIFLTGCQLHWGATPVVDDLTPDSSEAETKSVTDSPKASPLPNKTLLKDEIDAEINHEDTILDQENEDEPDLDEDSHNDDSE